MGEDGTKTPDDPSSDGPWWSFRPLCNALAAGLIAGTGFALAHSGVIAESTENIFYWLAIPLGGYHWAREGLEELVKEGVVGIEILMLAATAGSGLLGLWDEAAALVVLYGAAEGTEEYTYRRTRTAIRALLDLAPKKAQVLQDGNELTVPAESLQPGDRFIVRPGEAVPTDGVIHLGCSSLDESPITGESVPIDKGPGMKVFAASVNHQGALEIDATAAFSDNTLSKIIHLVEQAQERKGKAQQWIERFGRRYSPAVLIAAALFLVIPWLLDLALEEWSRRAVVLLVAAAPCALVMSMPVAMAAGIGAAGRRGILIKGGAHLEHLGSIQVVAFDKTGTLTTGKPAVTEVVVAEGSEAELLAAAAGLEHFSAHPLARAIVDHTRLAGVRPAEVDSFESLTGAGAKGMIHGKTWYVGNANLFESLHVDIAAFQSNVVRLRKQGKTVVLVGTATTLYGLIALRDQPRSEAKEAVAALHAHGLRTVMLTGDSRETANAVAEALGIDDVRAELKPDDKVGAIAQLEREQGAVLMVGDGVNDAPALAAATCGVAMGAAGSDAAVEAADVALMSEDLTKVIEAIHLGRKVLRVSRQNIVFATLILLTLIPLGVSGFLAVVTAVLVHEVSELLAVANGLRAGWLSEPGRVQRNA